MLQIILTIAGVMDTVDKFHSRNKLKILNGQQNSGTMQRDLSNRGTDIFQGKIKTHHSERFEHCDR